MPRYSLEGRTVLITGSTGGLGAAVAKALRARGAKLALLDIDGTAARAEAEALGPESVSCGWAVDVRQLDSVERAVKAAASHFGGIDVVIANAGITSMAPLESHDPTLFERVIDINLNGVWRTFRAALPYIKESKGYLLGVSSMGAFVHSPLQGPYVASKAGVWALCDATRLEVRHYGIEVGSLHPTFFKTPMMDEVQADPAGYTLWGGNKKGFWKMIPLETVVDSVIAGIERRAKLIVPTKQNAVVARVPGLFRPIVERLGFGGNTIPDAIAKVSKSTSIRNP